MTTNTSPGQTSIVTSRTAATQPVFSRSSARGQVRVRRADHLVGVLAEQLPDALGSQQRLAVAFRGRGRFRGLHGSGAVRVTHGAMIYQASRRLASPLGADLTCADDDRLELGEHLERMAAADAAGAAVGSCAAAEGEMVLPVVGRLVDVHEPAVHLVGEAEAVVEVAGEDARRAGRRGIRSSAGWPRPGSRSPPPARSGRRSPPSTASASGGHAVEHGGGPVQIGREAIRARSSGHDLGAALHRILDVLVHLARHGLVVERAHDGLGI